MRSQNQKNTSFNEAVNILIRNTKKEYKILHLTVILTL